MTNPPVCGKCGAPLTLGATEGLCPACLIKDGLNLVGAANHPSSTIPHPSSPPASPIHNPLVAPKSYEGGPSPCEGRGTRIGPYKLLQQLGEGGMGVVWMAEQTEPIRRKVALKIIKPGMDSTNVLARFEAERQALALMDHPNIAKIFDAGVTGDAHSQLPTAPERSGGGSTLHSQLPAGRPYFVMELVKGIPITTYCDEQRLSVRERLELFMPVCNAIQHAHQKGIIHRDLKPSNVLVAQYDGQPVPKVIDFGVAKAIGQQLTEKTLFTEFGAIIGTLEYMSPEQAEMNQLDIDTRSDIYSLGVLLYQLLTGTTPISRETVQKGALDEMLRCIREQEPPKPSTRLSESKDTLSAISAQRKLDPIQLTRMMRGDLDWIVMKALEKDRNRRYDTANGLAMDLQRHLQDEPVLARPASAAYRLKKFARKHRVAVAAAAGFVVLLAGATAVSSGLAIWANREKTRAVKAESEAQTKAKESQEVAQFLKDMIKGVGPSAAMGRDTKMLGEILERTAKRLNDLKGQPGVEADLRATLGNVYYDLGEYTEAAAMHRRALEIRKRLLGDENADIASSLNDLGKVCYRQRKLAEAESLHRQALAMRRKLLRNHDGEIATALFGLAEVLKEQGGSRAAAIDAYREAQAIWAMLPGYELDLAKALTGLGKTFERAGKPLESEPNLREAVAIQRQLLGEMNPDLAYTLGNLAVTLSEIPGKMAEAETNVLEALTIQKKVLGDHRDTALTLNLLGSMRLKQGRPIEAEGIFRDQLAIQTKVLNDNPEKRLSLAGLGKALAQQGRFAEAEEAYRQALSISRKFLRVDSSRAGLLARLVSVLEEQGKLAQGETLYHEVLEYERKKAEEGDVEAFGAVALYSVDLGILLEKQGKLAAAELSFRDAFEHYRRKDDIRAAAYLDHVARVLQKEGKLADAEVLCRDALARERKGAEAGDVQVLNDVAWNLATSGYSALRDGRSAVTFAEKAVAATNRKNPSYLDTLASAYAEIGQFSKAVSVQKEAIELNDDTRIQQEFAERLKLYESNTPYRIH